MGEVRFVVSDRVVREVDTILTDMRYLERVRAADPKSENGKVARRERDKLGKQLVEMLANSDRYLIRNEG